MSIKYTVVSNPLRPGQFYPRPVAMHTRNLKTLLRNVAKKTTISPSDIHAVVTAFIDEIVDGLLDGDRVSIDNLVAFRPRLSQTLNSVGDSFDPKQGGTVRLSASAKPQLARKLLSDAQFEKLTFDDKKPIVKLLLDSASGGKQQYTAGSIGGLQGKNLKIDDLQAEDQGVFFISAEDGTETQVEIFQNNGDRVLVFQIPASLSGLQNVEVRTRYTPDGKLRIGQLPDPIPAAVMS